MDHATAKHEYVAALSSLGAHLKLIDGLLELLLTHPNGRLNDAELAQYRTAVEKQILPLREQIDGYLNNLKRDISDNQWLIAETKKQLETIGKLLRNEADRNSDR